MLQNETQGKRAIAGLFDEGTFVELGARVKRPGCADRYEAVICGYGAVDGKLAFAFVEDGGVAKGAFDATAADKILSLYAAAKKNGAPVIGVFDSAGAVVTDGSRVLSAYGRVMKTVSATAGEIPQIALVGGVCSGMSAIIASMFDVTVIAGDKGQLYLGAQAGKRNAGCAIDAKDFASAVKAVRELVDMLPQNCDGEAASECGDDPARAAAADASNAGALISDICDGGKYIKLYTGEAGLDAGFCRFGGRACAVVGFSGRLTAGVADRAARIICTADAFGMPVVTLVNSQGVDSNADADTAAVVAGLASAYADSATAKITVITGAAYGAAFTVCGSLSLGADVVYALDTAKISPMSPESAVAFLWNDKITADTSRADLEAEWLTECADPELAAANGDIDDIIPAEQLRARICSAVFMLAEKSRFTED